LSRICSAAEGESEPPQAPQLDLDLPVGSPVLLGQTRRDLGALEAAMAGITGHHPHSTEVGPIDEFSIKTILRAVCLSGVSSAYRSQLPALSVTWQSVQFMLKAAEKKPIVPMNSFTGIPGALGCF